MKRPGSVLIVSVSGILAACAADQEPKPSDATVPKAQFVEAEGPISCPSDGTQMTSVTLFFGMAIPGGGNVSEGDWNDFLDHEVTPRFPDGLSVLQAVGQWKNAKTGNVIHEKSRALLIWMTPSQGASDAIDVIRDAYKARFKQDSVMRIDDVDCVAF